VRARDYGEEFAYAFILTIIFGSFILALLLARRGSCLYAATNKRLLKGKGLFKTKTVAILPVTQIEHLRVTQHPWQRLLGYGTLEFSTKDKTMKWVAVPRPRTVKRTIEEVIRKRRLAAEQKG
jgi:membrane protein YdbS with pleckstrin-like domain